MGANGVLLAKERRNKKFRNLNINLRIFKTFLERFKTEATENILTNLFLDHDAFR